ncbi:unnamed protein product [Parajaminaea phylloscopi]
MVGFTGQKEASYHLPPVESSLPTGEDFSIHHLRCLDAKIHLGFHLFPHIVHTLRTELPSSTYVVIMDKNVAGLYGDRLRAEWARYHRDSSAQPRFIEYVLPPGEMTKSREVKAAIEDYLLSRGCVRDTVIIALGGGVIGDLAGFVAATFMRGVKYVQVPTTLLAMVDSAVGGKTAIDTPNGKNLVGAFHQPRFIFIDAALLRTLPEREFSNGMAEVVKTAAIWDAADFAKLESSSAAIRSAVLSKEAQSSDTQGRHLSDRSIPQTLLLDVIRGSVGVKAHIVTIDEKETGLRNLVNFGHSIGHAIEAHLTPEILHGECVSIGMIFEAELSRRLAGFAQVNLGRLTKCLKAYNLPVSMSDPRIASLDKAAKLTCEDVLETMKVDKKNVGTEKKIVLLAEIGQCHEEKASTVADDVILRTIAPQIRVTPRPDNSSQETMRLSTPGSKSISNRALVLAALAKGSTRVRNLLHSDDTAVMMTGLGQLQAASFDWEQGGEVVVVHGKGGQLVTPEDGTEIYLQNAGTAARFMASVVALARDPQGKGRPTVITGNDRMKQRPIAPLVDALRTNGVAITHPEQDGFLPLSVNGEQGFKGGRIQLAASISSQYVSSILLCAPLAKEQDIVLELVGGKVISQPYIDMTIAMMKDFGVVVERISDDSGQPTDTYRIPRGGYVSPGTYDVESDASSATYPLAFAAITGASVIVEKIGSASLQGDARFATDVLAPMGCQVSQTETETHVTGPSGGLLHQFESGDVDMEPMTDAFLTASVLLAVAGSSPQNKTKSTRIRGIANQRVKECNRIKAMMDELSKFGVKTAEHEDGLEIFGIDRAHLNPGVSVHCYDDHRVAMAFSILAAVGDQAGTVLEEKRCVEKTWPNWWDDLETKLGGSVSGVDGHLIPQSDSAKARASSSDRSASTPLTTRDNSLTPRVYKQDATVFLIGMRGSGKTYLGEIGAQSLQRRFVDADVLFEERLGSLKAYVSEHGWPEFRARETEFLKELIRKFPTGHVIALGGGVVEAEENRALLKAYAASLGPVVHMARDLAELVSFGNSTDRPAWGESVETVWERRKPWFAECSSVELVNIRSLSALVSKANKIEAANSVALAASMASTGNAPAISIVGNETQESHVGRFFRFISGQSTNQVDLSAVNLDAQSRSSYLLTLTFPDLIPALPLLDELSAGTDALELRVDLLSPSGVAPVQPTVPAKEFVAVQLTALRQKTALPIVFTVRTKSQGGMFPDDAQDEYFDLVKMALRMGVEYIDLEITWPHELLRAVRAQCGHTKILASYHDWSGNLNWVGPDLWSKFELANKVGHISKLVGKATSMEDNLKLEEFRTRAASSHKAGQLLAINAGAAGQMSRILNPTLSLITHPSMPFPGAPGQLSFAQVQQARTLLGLQSRKKFALFGKPIAHSLSPCLHNTAHQTLGLPGHYERFETDVISEEVKSYIRSADFGGASVTIPLKLEIMPLLDELTAEAKIIGAVNTVIPVREAGVGSPVKLVGDNTDWRAIHSLCSRALSAGRASKASQGAGQPFSALVIGAGGSARAALYAAHRLGCDTIYLYNRTRDNAVKLAAEVPASWNVQVVSKPTAGPEGMTVLPRIIVSNVPADGTGLEGAVDAAGQAPAVILPAEMLSHPECGVVVDMSYKPHHTPLMELVRQRNATLAGASTTWTAVPGFSILLEQGCQQFELWTGRRAPRQKVETACWSEYTKGF